MKCTLTRVAVIFFAMIQVGCFKGYDGDGELVDNGIFEANWRYILTLEELMSSVSSKNTYRLENLPNKRFIIGFEIQNYEDTTPSHLAGIVVEVVLSKDEHVIFKRDEDLQNWTWSVLKELNKAFIYLGEESWFVPEQASRYSLEVSILPQEQHKNGNVNLVLVAKSPGWK